MVSIEGFPFIEVNFKTAMAFISRQEVDLENVTAPESRVDVHYSCGRDTSPMRRSSVGSDIVSQLGVNRRFNVRIPLHEGITLSADLTLPESLPAPAVVMRTPYGKSGEQQSKLGATFARGGYALIIVDVRGRGDSDGFFEPYRNDGRDGAEVIAWAAIQDWCDGAVATYGAAAGSPRDIGFEWKSPHRLSLSMRLTLVLAAISSRKQMGYWRSTTSGTRHPARPGSS